MVSVFTQIRDVDGLDRLTVQDCDYAHRRDIVVSVHNDAHGLYSDFDRAGAVSLIEALTAAVEAADAREAAEARKLKRGDRVRGRYVGRPYTVVSDETEDGRVDVVSLATGNLYTRSEAHNLVRE